MKKMISASGYGAIAIALLMSSCVSKKKYVQAQNTIEKYRMDSTQMAQTAAGLQQNISSLEEKNKAIQASWDSSKATAQAEMQRWSPLQTYYSEQRTNFTGLHEQLHTALDSSDVISAEDITSSNGRIYVTLDDQVFAGGQLSSKGRKAIAEFAGVIKDKDNVVVDVASGNSYAAYWNNTAGAMDNSSSDMSGSTASGSTSDDATASANSSDATSSRPTASTATARRSSSATARRSSTTTRSTRATAARSSATSTARRSESSGRNMSFRSKSASKSKSSWNTNIAKATAIAKELHKNGVYNVGMLVPGDKNTTNSTGTTTGRNNFQLIVSPKGDKYYEMLEGLNPSNGSQPAGSGTNNQGTGTGTGSGGGQ